MIFQKELYKKFDLVNLKFWLLMIKFGNGLVLIFDFCQLSKILLLLVISNLNVNY